MSKLQKYLGILGFLMASLGGLLILYNHSGSAAKPSVEETQKKEEGLSYDYHMAEGNKAMGFFKDPKTSNDQMNYDLAIQKAKLAIFHFKKAEEIWHQDNSLESPVPNLEDSYDTLEGLVKAKALKNSAKAEKDYAKFSDTISKLADKIRNR